MKSRDLLLIAACIFLALGIAGCASNPRLSDVAVTTPGHYSENKVLFVSTPPHSVCKVLSHGYELPRSNDRDVKQNGPVGVVLRSVRVPEDLSGDDFNTTYDIAVVIDVVTGAAEHVTSLVPFYQREVKPGQSLNFQDLLVYYDQQWDGFTPPWFRVRLVDVKAERNDRANRLLTEAAKLPGALSGVIPHPVLPAVSVAIEVARLILSNQNNKVILDFQVNFFSGAQRLGANADLLPLRIGEWIVVGRPRDADSTFWLKTLSVSSRSGLVFTSDQCRADQTVKVPYVSLALMQADAAVPQHILDRTQAFLQVLDSPVERKNADSLANALTALASSVTAYKSERDLKTYGTEYGLRNVIELAKKYNQAVRDNSPPTLQPAQVRSLLDAANAVTGQAFSSMKDLADWWDKDGSKGHMEKQKDGSYKWVLSPKTGGT
jgi:hypothetical protein